MAYLPGRTGRWAPAGVGKGGARRWSAEGHINIVAHKCETGSLKKHRLPALVQVSLVQDDASKLACGIEFKLLKTLPVNPGCLLSPKLQDLANMELTSTMSNSRSSSLVSSEASPMSRAKLANLQMTEQQLFQHNTGGFSLCCARSISRQSHKGVNSRPDAHQPDTLGQPLWREVIHAKQRDQLCNCLSYINCRKTECPFPESWPEPAQL